MTAGDLEVQYSHIIRHLSADQIAQVESDADVGDSPKLQRAREVFTQLQRQQLEQSVQTS